MTGCAQSPSQVSQPKISSEPAQDPADTQQDTQQPAAANREPITKTAVVQTATKPVEQTAQDIPQGYETGKPTEKRNVPAPEQPVKLSRLTPIYSVGSGTVAITIDDGPTKYTNELLNVLKENDTKVTFFFLGQNAAAYPQSVLRAISDGNEVGYHSNSHPKMTDMTLKEQENEFDLGLTKLKKLDSYPVTLFRPPYGAYNNDTKVATEEHHMNMVLWNEDPRDWSTTDPALVTKNVLSQVHSGSIIVMHDRPSTIAALPGIIKGIKSKGLKLVTIPAK
jgi:peptidoglycan/xylan/chitin deacetylase (PgdA/CDA1 family)